MIAQGAAVLAVAIKSKKEDLKELGFASTISAMCGVTEPAVYIISLRYKKVFISVRLVLYLVFYWFNARTMYGFTGGLIDFLHSLILSILLIYLASIYFDC